MWTKLLWESRPNKRMLNLKIVRPFLWLCPIFFFLLHLISCATLLNVLFFIYEFFSDVNYETGVYTVQCIRMQIVYLCGQAFDWIQFIFKEYIYSITCNGNGNLNIGILIGNKIIRNRWLDNQRPSDHNNFLLSIKKNINLHWNSLKCIFVNKISS